MKRALVVLALVSLAACGGKAEADKPHSSPSTAAVSNSTPSPAALDACTKLARTWAVAARDLKGRLLLMLPERVDESTRAMTSATDQMEVEGCMSRAREAALEGNYQAALANAQMAVCINNAADMCDKAADTWESAGEPLVAEVRSLTDMD